MKVALVQLNYTIGDFDGNKSKIINAINKLRRDGADLLVFAEQAITGAPAYDLLNKVTFLILAEEALSEIASYCKGISVIIGLPIAKNNTTISAAAVIENGEVVRFVGKREIRSRDEKWFITSSKGHEFMLLGGRKIAIVLGNDINRDIEYGDYADIIINIAASSYYRGVIENRYERFRKLAYKTGKPLFFINQVGGQTDTLYDGSSFAFNAKGEAIALLKSFEEDMAIVDVDRAKVLEVPYQNKTVNVYRAMKLGLADYFHKNGFKKACIGLSGGIDSALVLAVAVDALGADNVRVLMMPSQFSSDHSVDDAVEMAERLKVAYNVVPITEMYKSAVDSLKPVMGGTVFDVTEENIQSRIRCMLLMALSNKYGNILLNTSNKSENAVGYGTLYGDTAGSFSIIGDLYKIEIYDLARYINRDAEIIPENIILKEPSAELRPEQKDSDSLPPYDILDAILYRMIEEGQHREEIINAGFDAETVYKVYAMVKNNEYKRFQFCPTLRLSTVCFGKGRLMPLTSQYGF